MRRSQLFALIPAAGKSRRMGKPKLTMLLAGKTVVEHVVEVCRNSGIDKILVVFSLENKDLEKVVKNCGVNACLLPQETPDMRSTVENGLQWMEENWRPESGDAWFLIPADHPALNPQIFRSLVSARKQFPHDSIFLPTFQGKRGHPTLFDWKHRADILGIPQGQGINFFLRSPQAKVKEVQLHFPEILWDLDTPEDYENLLKKMKNGE